MLMGGSKPVDPFVEKKKEALSSVREQRIQTPVRDAHGTARGMGSGGSPSNLPGRRLVRICGRQLLNTSPTAPFGVVRQTEMSGTYPLLSQGIGSPPENTPPTPASGFMY